MRRLSRQGNGKLAHQIPLATPFSTGCQIDVFTTEESCLAIVWATIQDIRILIKVPLQYPCRLYELPQEAQNVKKSRNVSHHVSGGCCMSSLYPSFGTASPRPCQHCGMPLPLNEVYCRNCGAYIAPAPSPNAAPQPSSDTSWGEHHHHQTPAHTPWEHNHGNNLRSGQPNPTPLADFPRLNGPLTHPLSPINPSNQRHPTLSL